MTDGINLTGFGETRPAGTNAINAPVAAAELGSKNNPFSDKAALTTWRASTAGNKDVKYYYINRHKLFLDKYS